MPASSSKDGKKIRSIEKTDKLNNPMRQMAKDRFLPDKALDVIDEACSKVKIESLLSHFGLVSELEVKLQTVLQDKDTALRANEFELASVFRNSEMSLRTQIKTFLKSVEAPDSLINAQDNLPVVDTEHICSILSSWTGIPLNKVGKDESKKLLNLDKEMHTRIIGQHRAVTAICDSIKRTRVNLRNKKQPIASFLFCGPTGVGKTEVTKTLSEVFFGSEKAMVRFDMSEFMERHSIARLIGSPPGYIGYTEGGQLTEAIRRKPFSLVLFDEVEKAHPDVFNLLLQVLDDGRLTDGQGRTVDFKNTVIIMTSNLASNMIQSMSGDDYQVIKLAVMGEVKNHFRPEFINRIDEVVVFHALGDDHVKSIAAIQLQYLKDRLAQLEMKVEITDAALKEISKEGFDPVYGARPLKRAIQSEIENPLAKEILAGHFMAKDTIKIDSISGKLKFNKV